MGILVSFERFLVDAEEKGNPFVLSLLEKQHFRLKLIFDRHIVSWVVSIRLIGINKRFFLQNDQLQNIERTKLSSKKRNGVAHFVKYFSIYAARIEQQLIGANDLEIRTSVDSGYEKIVQTMFDSLKQIAKLHGEGEDKGQLNYHVILIGEFTKNGRRLFIDCFARKHALFRCRNISIGCSITYCFIATRRSHL